MVLGYTAMSNLHSLLTLSLYIALVSTVSRMYADSEMVIWQASGQSVLSLLAPALRFAWPWLITITALSLMAWPWSNMQIREMRERYEKRDDLQRIKPGQFQESADGKRVFFIDNSSIAEKTGNRIFVVSNENNTQSIVTAQTGVIETRDRDRFFILSNGQRIEIKPEKNEFKLIEFETHASKIDSIPPQLSSADAQSMQPLALLAEPTSVNMGELGWRIGMAIAAFNLVILAIAIPFINPRSGRSGSLIRHRDQFLHLLQLGQHEQVLGRWRQNQLARHVGHIAFACAAGLAVCSFLAPAARPGVCQASQTIGPVLSQRMKTIRLMIYREVLQKSGFCHFRLSGLVFFL